MPSDTMITVVGNNDVVTAMGLAGVQKLIELDVTNEECEQTLKEVIKNCDSKILVVGSSLADKYPGLLKQFKGIVVNLPEKDFDETENHSDVVSELIKDTLGIELNDD